MHFACVNYTIDINGPSSFFHRRPAFMFFPQDTECYGNKCLSPYPSAFIVQFLIEMLIIFIPGVISSPQPAVGPKYLIRKIAVVDHMRQLLLSA